MNISLLLAIIASMFVGAYYGEGGVVGIAVGAACVACVSDRNGREAGPTKEDGTSAERDPKGDAQET